MFLTTGLLPILGPIVAAMIAGVVAFLASVLSKEHKTSEFRQAWIDSLRNDLSEFLSISLLLQDIIAVQHRAGMTSAQLRESLHQDRAEFGKLEACAARIRLRLNPVEHGALIEAVKKLAEPSAESDQQAEDLINESHRVLKVEWKRVKRGEPIFVATKWVSLILTVCAMGTVILGAAGRLDFTFETSLPSRGPADGGPLKSGVPNPPPK